MLVPYLRSGRLYHRAYTLTRGVSSVSLSTPGPWSHYDDMSFNQSQKLDAALASYLPSSCFEGDRKKVYSTVPPGYHLAYFNPATPEQELSQDGYEEYQSPGDKFPNRMWLGGSVEFNKRIPLALNTAGAAGPAKCLEQVHKLDHSVKGSSERVTVTLDRKMYNHQADDWSVRELRSLIYFTQEGGLDRKAIFSRFLDPPNKSPANQLTIKPSTILLFRYSALTFNSHKIHYCPYYAKQVEQMPGVVVHGPLTVTLLLRWVASLIGPNEKIRFFSYKNLLPLFADNEMTLCTAPIDSSKSKFDVWILDHRGSMTVKGTVELE